jgi:hypothetical protein
LKYLKSTGTDGFKSKGVESLQASYQTIVSRKLRNPSGAYSELNNNVASIETTAFVAKFLGFTKEWIEVDDSNLVDALNFLKKKQDRTGKFEELTGEASDDNEKSEVALTAIVAVAFLENEAYMERFKQVITKALSFIDGKFDATSEGFDLSVAAYALALGKHESAKKFSDKLMKLKQGSEEEEEYWTGGSDTENIETASYALLALAQLEEVAEGRKILNWLISKRSSGGGFIPSKANVIGLQALAEVTEHVYSRNFNLKVIFDERIEVKVLNNNAKEVQNVAINSNEGVSVQLEGTGVAFVQVWQKYLPKNESIESSEYEVSATPTLRGNKMSLRVCVKYTGPGSKSKPTIAEIALPTGYEFNSKVSHGINEMNRFRNK